MKKRSVLFLVLIAVLLISLSVALLFFGGLGARSKDPLQSNQSGGQQTGQPSATPDPDDILRQNGSIPIPPSASDPKNASCGPLQVHILNVSQADAILIITPGNKTIMIDSGSHMKKNSSSYMLAYLKQSGIKRIDYLIATHYHEDHIGGMDDLFKSFDIGAVYDNGNCGNYSSAVQLSFEGYALSRNFTHVKTDMDLPADPCLDAARLIVAYDRPQGCWPSSKESSNENDNSILLRLAYRNASFLFAGDCEADCEAELVRQGTYLGSDFLKVGHHGSATSSTKPFLDAVGAAYYAISVDRIRSISDGYFHPRKESLSNIYEAGGFGSGLSKIFRTDLQGDISLVSDGDAIAIRTGTDATNCQLFSGYSSSDKSSYGPIPALAGSCK